MILTTSYCLQHSVYYIIGWIEANGVSSLPILFFPLTVNVVESDLVTKVKFMKHIKGNLRSCVSNERADIHSLTDYTGTLYLLPHLSVTTDMWQMTMAAPYNIKTSYSPITNDLKSNKVFETLRSF